MGNLTTLKEPVTGTREIGRPKHKPAVAEAFARRLLTACENHPSAPPMFRGQQVWLREELCRKGVVTTPQSVSKWFKAESLPTVQKISVIAEVLGVDPGWLANGSVATRRKSGLSDVDKIADPMTRLVASMIELDGGAVALADLDANGRSFKAIIRSASYDLMVAPAAEQDGNLVFSAPRDPLKVTIVVHRAEGFNFTLYEATSDEIDKFAADTRVRAGLADVAVPLDRLNELRQITTFKERL